MDKDHRLSKIVDCHWAIYHPVPQIKMDQDHRVILNHSLFEMSTGPMVQSKLGKKLNFSVDSGGNFMKVSEQG